MKIPQILSAVLALLLVGCFADGSVITQDTLEIEGTRPLIVLLAEYPSDVAETSLQPGYAYNDLFVSGPRANVQDYFTHNSYGRFTISFQGVWGPYQVTNTETISTVFADVILEHVAAGNSLGRYDTNGDGTLTSDELMIVVIGNGGPWGGAVRGVSVDTPGGLEVRSEAVIVGSQATLATIIHESLHLLGTYDIYGSDCNSADLSVMSCTVHDSPGDFSVWLDPWHRMQLGWVEPRFVEIDPSTSLYECFDLHAPQYRGRAIRDEQRPLLLYNPVRDPDEYLMVEFRTPYFEEPGYNSYEHAVPDQGVVIWSIRLQNGSEPFQVPSVFVENKTDLTIWTFGSNELVSYFAPFPIEEWATKPGLSFRRVNPRAGTIWQSGAVDTEWQDGTQTGAQIFIGELSFSGNSVEVCVAQEGDPYVLDGGR